jgi:hypothetical protein
MLALIPKLLHKLQIGNACSTTRQLFLDLGKSSRMSRNSFGPLISARLRRSCSSTGMDLSTTRSTTRAASSDASLVFLPVECPKGFLDKPSNRLRAGELIVLLFSPSVDGCEFFSLPTHPDLSPRPGCAGTPSLFFGTAN